MKSFKPITLKDPPTDDFMSILNVKQKESPKRSNLLK